MRDAFAKALTKIIIKNKKTILIIGDTGSGVFDEIKKKRPNQFINAGIAEANMVTVASGLSSKGFTVFVYAIGPHVVYRAYEQIRNDLCLNKSNVKIISVGSGLHYSDHGPTHHSTEDFAVLKCLPNIKILSPAGTNEVIEMTKYLSRSKGPAYLRLGRGNDDNFKKKFNIKKYPIIKKGNKLTIFATGAAVNESYELINNEFKDKSIELINVNTIKPINEKIIIQSAKKNKKIIVIEEHQKIGGLSETIFSLIAKSNIKLNKSLNVGIDDIFCSYSGSYEGIKKKFKLSKRDLKNKIESILN
jgi:transketolase